MGVTNIVIFYRKLAFCVLGDKNKAGKTKSLQKPRTNSVKYRNNN